MSRIRPLSKSATFWEVKGQFTEKSSVENLNINYLF